MYKNGLLALGVLALTACGSTSESIGGNPTPNLPTPGVTSEDGFVVHGRAIFTIDNTQQTALMKFLSNLIMPLAYAATGSVPVTYTNATATNFTINTTGLGATGFTGDVLNLGSVALASLSDNNLKVCGSGTTKCTSAAIRVYTTGSTAGFVNTVDAYGAPVFAGTLNPASPVGLLAAGSVQVQTLTIPGSKRTVKLSDFATPTYSITSDFSNAGAGSYSMTFVVEYVLQ